MLEKVRQWLKTLFSVNANLDQEVDAIVESVGGIENIVHCGACATRLRLQLATTQAVQSDRLKREGAFGVIRLDEYNVQIIYGMKANNYSQVIEQRLLDLR